MSRFGLHVLLAGSWLLLTGCLHHRLDAHYQGPKGHFEQLKYEAAKPAYNEKVVEKTGRFTRKEIRFAWSERDTQLLTYYEVPVTNKSPVIVISTALGGSYWLEKRIARYYAGRGYPVVIVHRVGGKIDPKKETGASELNRSLEERIRQHQRALDWIATQPTLDAEKIGVIGISKGAIDTTLLLSHDSRVKAGVLVLAGGNLPYILAYTREPHLEKQRAAILENLKLDQQAFREKLAQELEWDPVKFADRIDARSVLMILAVCDTIVPFKTGLELRSAMGKPETYFLPTGHLTAFFLKSYIQRKALDFFERKFAESPSKHSPLATVETRLENSAPSSPANRSE
jgi:dienelactone hydrolase